MPVIKNRLFQPIGVMLGDGNMLHLRSREERDVSATDLASPHLAGLIANRQLALRERDRQESAAPPHERMVESTLPALPESEPAQAPESRRPKRLAAQRGPRHQDETE